jgi:hypothetical protein
MQWGPAIRTAAVLAVVFVLLIFLFPGGRGPYPITHGPATALRALRAAVLMLLAMAVAAAMLASLLRRFFATAEGLPQRSLAHIVCDPAAAGSESTAARTFILLC